METVFGLLGGLAVFLFGMNMMSEGLQKAAGAKMKSILSLLTSNPVLGVLAGAVATAVLQSSSATTVMAIGFVSARLMTMRQAIAVIFGANIGTTMTAQLMAFKISDYIWLIVFVGFIVWFVAKDERVKNIGQTVFAFGLLFVGIDTMGAVMKPLAQSDVFLTMIDQVKDVPVLGVAVGNIFAGIPMDAAGDYAGVPLIGLITPFTLLTGLLGLVMFLAAGACWAALKAPLPSYLQARAARLRLPLQVIALVLFAVVSVYALVLVGPEMDPNLGILRWLFAALVVVGLLASLVVGKTSGDDLKAFLAQSASMIALVALLACSMFPVLVNATADSVGPAITLANAASSELSLTWMTIILCIGLPLVLVYHVVIYRTFRGRVNPADLEEY